MNGRRLQFEWDPAKDLSNLRKHGVGFDIAATIFLDPRILTMFDEAHSESEDRWIGVGLTANGAALVVVYTWTEIDRDTVNVRIISARTATPKEIHLYEQAHE